MPHALRQRGWSALALAASLWVSCRAHEAQPPRAATPEQAREQTRQDVKYLDPAALVLTQRLEPADGDPATAKFVEIEVTEVRNPKQLTASFKVGYKPLGGEELTLGYFSLFPADNPGTFIVATSGRLKATDTLVLSLMKPDDFRAGDTLRVAVKRLRLVKESPASGRGR